MGQLNEMEERRMREKELPLPVGTRVKFETPYGSHAGTHEGIIVARMVPNPHGFLNPPGLKEKFEGHYEVEAWVLSGQGVRTKGNIIVTPQMVKEVLSRPPEKAHESSESPSHEATESKVVEDSLYAEVKRRVAAGENEQDIMRDIRRPSKKAHESSESPSHEATEHGMKVVKAHDDGDVTAVDKKGTNYVLTTDGRMYRETKERPHTGRPAKGTSIKRELKKRGLI